jgi:metallo-beta-lactamase family protein
VHSKLKFLGAAGNVTGSRHLLEAGEASFLIDCGFYQERHFRSRNWEPFPVEPSAIDAVLLTHAHLDHSGLLPKLVRDGFRGRIYCTAATADIVRIMLLDSAKIQEEDAEFKRRRHEREGKRGPYPEIPLYTTDDAEACLPHLSAVQYGQPVRIGDGVAATFQDAGHVLGSSMIRVAVSQNGVERVFVFSGDIGRWNRPILRDPTILRDGDYVLVESTYGDRLHEGSETIEAELGEVVNSTLEAGGNVVVPSFALERAQEVMYYLNSLLLKGRVPGRLRVFLDSPMAVSITEAFERNAELFDCDMRKLVQQGKSPFDFPELSMVRSVEESKEINAIAEGAMIIAGSGMCTGGRIKHHLAMNISRPECTVLFVGYQAVGTLGRQIVDGAKEVRVLGQNHPVRARVAQIQGFSAHADRDDLFRWLSGHRSLPRQVFVVHGEPETASDFADFIREKTGWKVSVPEYGEEATLD